MRSIFSPILRYVIQPWRILSFYYYYFDYLLEHIYSLAARNKERPVCVLASLFSIYCWIFFCGYLFVLVFADDGCAVRVCCRWTASVFCCLFMGALSPPHTHTHTPRKRATLMPECEWPRHAIQLDAWTRNAVFGHTKSVFQYFPAWCASVSHDQVISLKNHRATTTTKKTETHRIIVHRRIHARTHANSPKRTWVTKRKNHKKQKKNKQIDTKPPKIYGKMNEIRSICMNQKKIIITQTNCLARANVESALLVSIFYLKSNFIASFVLCDTHTSRLIAIERNIIWVNFQSPNCAILYVFHLCEKLNTFFEIILLLNYFIC